MKIFRGLVLLSFAYAGCTAAMVTSGPPAWRHPFLYHEEDGSGKGISVIPDELRQSSGDRREICPGNFNHPLLNRCRPVPKENSAPATVVRPAGKAEDGLRIAAIASGGLSKRGLSFSRSEFGNDCSGFVLAVLARAGRDLRPRLGVTGGASTAAIFQALEADGKISRHKVPFLGDLVFFDNTYDRNRDGRANDPLTHVGIVEKVDADGTISFVHRVKHGVLRYRMNLFEPHSRRDPKSGKVLNHPLRYAGRKKSARLAGELFHAFARVTDY